MTEFIKKYTSKHLAPKTVEFQCETISGFKVIRIMLDFPSPRIYAFNESSAERSPTVLWVAEIIELTEVAKRMCNED